jgi:hypothetical protein
MRDRSRISMFSDSMFVGRILSKRENWVNYGVKNTIRKIDKSVKSY